jgi:hypothetical protein
MRRVVILVASHFLVSLLLAEPSAPTGRMWVYRFQPAESEESKDNFSVVPQGERFKFFPQNLRVLPTDDKVGFFVVNRPHHTNWAHSLLQDFVPVREFRVDFGKSSYFSESTQSEIVLGAARVIELRGMKDNKTAILVRNDKPFPTSSDWREDLIDELPQNDGKRTPLSKREVEFILQPEELDSAVDSRTAKTQLAILARLREAYGSYYEPLYDLDTRQLEPKRDILEKYPDKGVFHFLWRAIYKGSVDTNHDLLTNIEELKSPNNVQALNNLGHQLGLGYVIETRTTDWPLTSLSRHREANEPFYVYFVTNNGRKLYKYLEERPDLLDAIRDFSPGKWYYSSSGEYGKMHQDVHDSSKSNKANQAKNLPPVFYDQVSVFDSVIRSVVVNQTFHIPPHMQKACFVGGKEKTDVTRVASYCCINVEKSAGEDWLTEEVESQVPLSIIKRAVTFGKDKESTAWLFVSGFKDVQSISCTTPIIDENNDQLPDPMPFPRIFAEHFRNYATLIPRDPRAID